MTSRSEPDLIVSCQNVIDDCLISVEMPIVGDNYCRHDLGLNVYSHR